MNKIVTTSLLIAAGIAVSACNVTTGTGNSAAYQFESDSDRRLEAASQAVVTVTPSVAITPSGGGFAAGGGQAQGASHGNAGDSPSGDTDNGGTGNGGTGGTDDTEDTGGDTGNGGNGGGHVQTSTGYSGHQEVQAFQHQNAQNIPTGGGLTTTWVPNDSND